MEPTPPRSAPWTERLALLAPLALAVAGSARSLRGELQFDDLAGVAEGPAVRDFPAWLRATPLPEALLTGRPLTALTFAANYAAGRLDPLGFHLVNLALHLATILLVGRLALAVAGLAGAARPRRIALGVAGLFAVHPLQSAAVSYVSQRAEVLGSLLYAATLLVLLPLASPAGQAAGRRRLRWAGALVLFLLGFAAKPIVVTVPVAFLAILLAADPGAPGAAGAGGTGRTRLPALAGLGALALALGVALLVALRGRPDAGFDVVGVSPWRYLLTQLRAFLVYLRLLLWPAGQRVDWDFPLSPGLGDPATLAAAAAVAGLAAGAVALLVRGRRRPGPDGAAARLGGLGLAWFFVVLAPTSSLVPLADPLVEHRAYLAAWGVLLAVVAAADALAERHGARRLATAGWILAVAALAVALHQRNAVWETREALWRDAVEKTPGSTRAHLNLGTALDEQGRLDEAIRHYEVALASAGPNRNHRGQVLLNLGVAQLGAGRPEAARQALEAGRQALPDNDLILVNLAVLAGGSGDAAGAETLARQALALNPARAAAWVVLGHLGLERSDWAAALAAYDRAVALDRERGDAHLGRALVFEAQGREAEACAALGDALRAGLRPEERSAVAAQVAARCR